MVTGAANEPSEVTSELTASGERISFRDLQRQIQAVQKDAEHCLVIFHRQYLQRLDLSLFKWPGEALLCIYDVQRWVFELMVKRNVRSPHPSYDKRFAKMLVSRIETAVENTEERDIYDPLLDLCTNLYLARLPDDFDLAQRDIWLRYTLPSIPSSIASTFITSEDDTKEITDTIQTIDILEKPNLLSASSCTGFRTWEAALRLATLLSLPHHAERFVRGGRVLELGAGTGLLSLVCARLGARKVVATDGDAEAVRRFEAVVSGNGLTEIVECGVYWWGEKLQGDDGWNLVVAADVTYEPISIPALVTTICKILKARPSTDVLLSATVRNEETFKVFTDTCDAKGLSCSLDTFADSEIPPLDAQTGLFHTGIAPIKIVHVTMA